MAFSAPDGLLLFQDMVSEKLRVSWDPWQWGQLHPIRLSKSLYVYYSYFLLELLDIKKKNILG